MRLDFGCGPNKREGFTGVDQYPFDGKVDIVGDVTDPKFWDQFESDSVEEAHASHFLEHLTERQRVLFVNQLHRILKPGSKAVLITPHWASCRAYGDPTHQWPPVSEFFWYYLDKNWRAQNAPHTDAQWLSWGFTCDYETTWGYGLHPDLQVRSVEFQQDAVQWKKEAILDMHATMTCRK